MTYNIKSLELRNGRKSDPIFTEFVKQVRDGSLSGIPSSDWSNRHRLPLMCNGKIDLRFVSFDIGILEDLDLSNCNLEGVHFSGTTLRRCNFSSAELVNATFEEVDLQSCIFDRANLMNADFLGGSLRECRFDLANLHRTNFSDCRIDQVSEFTKYMVGDALRNIRLVNFSTRRGLVSRLNFSIRWILTVLRWFYLWSFPRRYRQIALAETRGNTDSTFYLFSRLAVLLAASGNMRGAKIAEFHAMRSHFDRTRVGFTETLKWYFHYAFGFYMSPRHIIFISFAVILCGAFWYKDNPDYVFSVHFSQCSTPQHRCIHLPDKQFAATLNFTQAFYFSSVTFATLGYGDITPRKVVAAHDFDNVALSIPALQAFIGAILMALGVASIVRMQSLD